MEFAISAATSAVRPVEGARVEPSQPSGRSEDRVEKSDVKVQAKSDVRDLQRAADRLNQALQTFDRDLAISIHDDGKVVVRVTDPQTGDVVRQIPPERVLEVEENLDKIVGLFVNDHA